MIPVNLDALMKLYIHMIAPLIYQPTHKTDNLFCTLSWEKLARWTEKKTFLEKVHILQKCTINTPTSDCGEGAFEEC